MSIFGAIVTGAQVEAAVVKTLQLWLPTYLAEMERQTDRERGSLPAVRSYTTLAGPIEKWPENQTPAVVVSADGTTGSPVREGSGVMRARWVIGIGVVVQATGRDETNDLVKVYAAAVRATLMQRPSLGGFARDLEWIGETYDVGPREGVRTIRAAVVGFEVEVASVVDTDAGPAVPDPKNDPTEPYSDRPTVLTHELDVTREPIA